MERVAILVAGPPGAGKSTLVERLAKAFDAKPVFASGLMRALHRDLEKARPEDARKGEGFWEGEEGKKLLRERARDPWLDRELDRRLLAVLEKEPRVVMDSWTMPWLYKGPAFRVWLSAPEQVRAKRVAKRDGLPVAKVRAALRERFATTAAIYKELYGFDLGRDLSPFHLVLTDGALSKDEVFARVQKAARAFFSKTRGRG